MIRQRYRDEFEQLGVDDLRKRLAVGMYDEDKRKAGREWIDEQEHGEDRAHKAEQLRLQRRADFKGTVTVWISIVAVAISAIALYAALEPRFRGPFVGQPLPTAPSQAPATPAPATK